MVTSGLAAVAVVTAAAVGYLLVDESDEHRSSPTEPWTPPDHPVARAAEPRDERAVLAGLRLIDACALIEPTAKRVPPFSSRYRVEPSPHQCEIWHGWNPAVRATVGTVLNREKRFAMRRSTIAGARAYVLDHDGCEVNIPVSSSRAIQIHVSGQRDQNCRIAERFGAGAIEGLADQPSVRSETPWTRWDACTILRRAVADDLGGRHLVPDATDFGGLDYCGITGSRLAMSTPIDLQLRYSSYWISDRQPGETYVDIGGRPVQLSAWGKCSSDWIQGPSGMTGPRSGWFYVALQAPNCDRAKSLTRSIMKVLGGPSPAAAPRHPGLVYRPGEPDVPVAGACLHLTPGWQCTPYDHVSPPVGAAEVARATSLDPNVNCAISFAAVREHFGPGWTPVTTTRHEGMIVPEGRSAASACVFVEPTHTLQVWVTVRDHDILPLAMEGFVETSIAGLPATGIEVWDSSIRRGDGTGFSIAFGDDIYTADQYVEAWIVRYPPRGTVPTGIDRDLGPASELPDMLTDIIETHLR